MRFYSVFADQSADDSKALEDAVFIKNGFSWPAFLVFPLWSLYHWLWLPFLAWLVVSVTASTILALVSAPWHWGFLASLGIATFMAFEAGAFRRAQMVRKNYSEIGQVSGHSLVECETVFFSQYLDQLSKDEHPAQPEMGQVL